MKRLVIIIFILLIILFLAVVIVLYKNKLPRPRKLVGTNIVAEKVIARVGKEALYQKDLDFELTYAPAQTDEQKRLLVEKLIKDSLILQAGADDNIIELDDTVFNNVNKDHLKRIGLVRKVEKEVEGRSDRIQGTMVSIYYYNNGIGILGYEKSKEIAKEKITQLYDKVVSGKMTIDEAGEAIKNDVSLEEIDVAYRANAIKKFDSVKGEKITFDPQFDDLLWVLSPGELTPIYSLKENKGEDEKDIETLYAFAQLEKHDNSGYFMGFEQWYTERKDKYPISYD